MLIIGQQVAVTIPYHSLLKWSCNAALPAFMTPHQCASPLGQHLRVSKHPGAVLMVAAAFNGLQQPLGQHVAVRHGMLR